MQEYQPRMLSTYALTLFPYEADVEGRKVSVDFWDTAGQERFNSLHPSCARPAPARAPHAGGETPPPRRAAQVLLPGARVHSLLRRHPQTDVQEPEHVVQGAAGAPEEHSVHCRCEQDRLGPEEHDQELQLRHQAELGLLLRVGRGRVRHAALPWQWQARLP